MKGRRGSWCVILLMMGLALLNGGLKEAEAARVSVDGAQCTVAVKDPEAAMNAYNNEFYVVDEQGAGYFKLASSGGIPGRTNFWTSAEEVEMIEDAWERNNKSPVYATMVVQLLQGLNTIVAGTPDWNSWNIYNDDIMWGVLALVRGYKITGNPDYLAQAQQQYDAVYARGWDQQLGGGLFWNTDNQTKNACVNGPASIAGFLLALYTGDTSYSARALQTFQWLFDTLFNATTGQVADHIDLSGVITDWAFTYNQGTFIGAATLANYFTKDPSYLDYAYLAANWTRTNLTGQHLPLILNDEYGTGPNAGMGDGVGFKGIFARWCGYYAQHTANTDIMNWLVYNANTAWSYRNDFNVTWAQWWHATPSDYVTSWECSSAAVIFQTAFC